MILVWIVNDLSIKFLVNKAENKYYKENGVLREKSINT